MNRFLFNIGILKQNKNNFTPYNVNYGNLYNYGVVSDNRNITASGWHIPTKTEIESLILYLSGDSRNKLLTGGTSGFNAKYSGIRDTSNFNSIEVLGSWWSSTVEDDIDPDNPMTWICDVMKIQNNTNEIYIDTNTGTTGNSIRVIKDSTLLINGQRGEYIGNDGKKYYTICINNQEWLANNLCETKYRNGDFIATVTDQTAWNSLIIGAKCSYANNSNNVPFDDSNIYYVSITGNNSNSGSFNEPFLTIEYACDNTTSGDTIHLIAGNYNVDNPCYLNEGVDIEGEGDDSLIISSITNTSRQIGVLIANSLVHGANGNQSIRYLKLDGDSGTGYRGLVCWGRSNVDVQNLTVIEFLCSGMVFIGAGTTESSTDLVWATGNTIHGCTLDDTSTFISGDGKGELDMVGQDAMLVYDNVFDFSTGTAATNGYNIKQIAGNNKNCKIYDNTFTKPLGSPFPICIEIWESLGGNEIYNNIFYDGYVDVVRGVKGSSTFNCNIYKNTFELRTKSDTYVPGIVVEGGSADVLIHHNSFEKMAVPISLTQNATSIANEYIYIYYNIFKDTGYATQNAGGPIRLSQFQSTNITRYIYIDNNVMYDGGTGSDPWYGIHITADHGDFNHIYVRNNIFQGFTRAFIAANITNSGDPTLDYVWLQNNISYGNGNSNDPWYPVTAPLVPTNVTDEDRIESDPLFVTPGTDFHLQAGSPAINAGIDLGYDTDYDDEEVSNPPEIGVYEYV